MKKALKILSIALTVVLIIGIFSCATPVFAAEVTEKENLNSTVEQLKAQVEDSENKTLYEIEEERDAFTKVFQNNDGTKTAIVSATPIHYETDEGWADIENTLVEKTSSSGKVYKNKNNDFTVTIPKELSENKELEIKQDDYSVSFELDGNDIFSTDKKVNGNKKNKKKNSIESNGEISTEFLDKTEEVVFENVGKNTSFEYEVTSTGLKENIVLKNKPVKEVEYNYIIKTHKLSAELNPDNSVAFINSDEQIIFEIPAPIMYDAENLISKDIEVTLSGEKGKYILTYKPSYEWLSGNIKYPVVIDPVINTVNENLGIVDAIADSANPNDNFGDEAILCTFKSDTGNQQSFIDISNNYIIKNGAKIKTVLLGLYYENGIFIDNSTTVAAYTVTSDWNESTLTYNNRPSTVNSLIERKEITRDQSADYILFDVTKAYTLNEESYGVCIRQRDSVTNLAQLIFSSSETANSSHQPFFVIEYYESHGVEEQFDYHTFDVGRAGTVYFNDFSEQVYIEREELGLSGINMPVQIKQHYNSGFGGTYSRRYSTYYGPLSANGAGWRTNYNQFIEYHSDIDGEETILYYNGNAQTIYFEKGEADSETGQTVWNEKTDEFSGSEGYTMHTPNQYADNVSNNLQYVTIKDASGQVYEFNSDGYLSKINSAEENSSKNISITYIENGYDIAKITDGVGREYRFSYTEYESWPFPLMTSVQAFSPSGSPITVNNEFGEKVPYKMSYTYEFSDYLNINGLPTLSTVTYPDDETVYYTFNDNLISLKNIDGYAIEFDFNQSNTVIYEKAYSENGVDFTSGGQLTITDENSYEKSYVDLNGTKITKQFDMYGRTINTKNNGDITQSIARTYSDDYKAQGSVSYSFYNNYERDIASEATNLVTNGSFTTNLSGWSISSSSKVKRTGNYDCDPNNETPGSLQISGVQNAEHCASQTIDVENGKSGDEYRLDYFVKNTTHSHMIAGLAKLDTIMIAARNNVNGSEDWSAVALVDANPFNDNWQKYSYTFDIDFEYNEIGLIVCFFDQYGTVRYDDISLVNTYKAPANQVTDTETGNENTGSSGGNSDIPGCDCKGCSTPNCPCTACSDNCTLPYCNRGYDFKNDSSGISFSITDGEKTMAMEQNVIGNYYGSQTDLNGVYTGYSYNQMNGQLEYMSDSNGNVTNFYYDAMSRLNKVKNNANGIEMQTSYSYANDRIESITHNGFSYNYEYDVWGNPTAVKVGEQALVSYTYDSENETRDRINRITYGNGDYTDYDYDNDGNIERIKSYSSENVLVADYLYAYDENGQIEKITNNIEDTEIRYTDTGYDFVKLNNEGEADDFVIYSKNIEDDGKTVEILAGKEYNETNGTTHSDAVSGTTTVKSDVTTPQGNYSVASATDYFGRVKYKDTILRTEVGNGYMGSEKIREAYEYADSQDPEEPDRTTGLVSKYTITHGTYVETVDKEINPNLSTGFYEIYSIKEYLYDYDDNGNITRIRLRTVDDEGNESLTELNSYVYDSANQLVRENNAELNKTFVYVYDKGGNIAQKKEYAYSTGELGEAVSIINYSYDNAWKDKLTAYGDTQIQTDAMGNPLNYSGISINDVEVSGILEWNGRQLAAANVGNERFEYSYDANGLRTSVKYYSSGGDLARTYYYIWQNGKLVGYYVEEASGNNGTSIKLLFDEKGEPIGYMSIETGGDGTVEYFLFRKNLQGDITAVCEQNGNEIITYSYDAWGKVVCTPQSGDLAAILSALICTPITYRGYNYDVFTGLYYLQSRYYNPTYGRFLNADSIMKTGEPLGANIFAYCGNNPVNFVDYDGRDALSVITNILYLLVVVAVMDNDGLLEENGSSDDFSFIFEGATSVTFRLLKYDDEVMVLEAYFIHNIVNDFRIYTVSIDIIAVDAIISAVDNLMFDYVENDVVDTILGGLTGLLFEIPQEIDELSIFEDVATKIENYQIISFLRTKRDQASSSGEQYVVFVDMITMHYTTIFGNTKKKTIYSCYR